MSISNFIHIHPEVQAALADKRAIVALESTVITHGLPYPDNVKTAVAMQTAVREGGAIPATIAILKGIIHVGLTDDELEALGQMDGSTVRKCSRRDIPLAIARKEYGATTVAGTMILANEVGISVFATGGIGGVHRGHPFDVSADLTELGRTPVAVVSSGAKSILDLPATREVLETNGIPVIGYGTDEMPAFFSSSSGLPVDARIDTPEEAAAIIRAHHALSLQNGMLFTVPVPAAEAFDSDDAEEAIAQATQEAEELHIHGKESTPWLLSRVVELTDGRSMRANMALLRNNGRVAGQIAAALSTK